MLKASKDEIEVMKAEAIDNDRPFYVSGFELWGDDITNADIRELYPEYWVLVDNENGIGAGIFGTELKATTLEEAINEAENQAHYSGEGYRFSADQAKLVYSNKDIHIFEL